MSKRLCGTANPLYSSRGFAGIPSAGNGHAQRRFNTTRTGVSPRWDGFPNPSRSMDGLGNPSYDHWPLHSAITTKRPKPPIFTTFCDRHFFSNWHKRGPCGRSANALSFRHLANDRSKPDSSRQCRRELVPESITKTVQSKYASVAKSGLSTGHPGVRAVAEAFGYTPEQLASIPAEANMGLSCGNPTAFASLKPGETVVDLGCGGGLDVFLAAKRVGPTGKAIGVDMTPEMLDLARRNAAKADGGKPAHERRVLPGNHRQAPHPGRLRGLCDQQLRHQSGPRQAGRLPRDRPRIEAGRAVGGQRHRPEKPLPPEIGNDLMAYVGCIAGAIPLEEYRTQLIEAGFAQVDIIDTQSDLNAYAKAGEPIGLLLPGHGIGVAHFIGGFLLFRQAVRRRRPSSAICRPAAAVQRQRLCGQRPGVCREAGVTARPCPSHGGRTRECYPTVFLQRRFMK